MRIGSQTIGKLTITENAFDSGLSVIEIALHRADIHIRTSLRAHLQFLYLANLAFRIEHGDACALGIRETSERRLAGVSGGGCHDHDFLVAIAAGRGGACHETRQDLQCDIFECGGRAVKQFHHVVIAERLDRGDLFVGPLRAVRFIDACLEFGFGEVGQQHAQHVECDLLVGLACERCDVYVGFAQ